MKKPVNRYEKHRRGRKWFLKQLQERGIPTEQFDLTSLFDFRIHETVRLSLRVAERGTTAHYVVVGGRRYNYNYHPWNFNFHRHGQWENITYCDYIVCIARHYPKRGQHTVFVVPADKVTGPTFAINGASDRPYNGRYAPYRERWVFLDAPPASAAATA